MTENTEQGWNEAAVEPKNLGGMEDADAVGTVGSPDCGDMVRMWIKFKEENGKKVIDRASFQSFGCQTAIAVASMATELLKGKTREEALQLSVNEMTAGVGALPPMKIHCGQMVEGALKAALEGEVIKRIEKKEDENVPLADALLPKPQKFKIVLEQ
jgi:nitrogen fixation NifU-like protein